MLPDSIAPGFSVGQLGERLRHEQRLRWLAGDRVPAEDFFASHPDLDADTALDLIFQEFLIRQRQGERPQLSEYRARFPEHAAMLAAQLELERALAEVPATATPAHRQSTLTTGTCFQPAFDGAAAPQAPEEEQRVLLRVRWRNLCLIGIPFLLTQALVFVTGAPLGPARSPTIAGVHVLVALVLASFVALAWRRPGLSLRQLRWLELASFAAVAAGLAVLTWDFFRSRILTKYAEQGPEGILVLAFYLSLRWFALLVIYGLFIPNSWRRCTIVVGAMALAPVVLGTGLAWADDSVAVGARLTLIVHLTWWMAFGVVLAVYGCRKMQVLRQEAYAARHMGQYKLKARLGTGGMGEVYLAEHALLRRPCAVKIIRPERAANPKDLRRFEREVQATAALTHPNTVRVYDYGHAADGTFYYAMEYVPGPNLEELVERVGPLAPERVIALLQQVCGALAEAHASGLVHRDIKPSNIIVSEQAGKRETAKLLDFGLVCSTTREMGHSRLTQDRDIAGTPAFMSPEQATGQRELDARSDIYSLGALAYFLLTGRPPFTSQSALRVLAAHMYESPPPFSQHGITVPAKLEQLVLRCLAKNPAERFARVRSLEAALALALMDCWETVEW